MRILTTTYEALLKDRAIIAAEVLHEYDLRVRCWFHILSSTSLNLPPISMFPHESIQ